MRVAYAPLLLLAAASASLSQPPTSGEVSIVPPGPTKPLLKWAPTKGAAPVGTDVTLTIGVEAEWEQVDAGPTLREEEKGKRAVVRSESPGTFRFLVTPKDGKAQPISVTFAGQPAPPGPNPLRDRLKTAYGRDVPDVETPEKRATLVKYAMLYRKGAELAEDLTIPTVGELGRIVSESRDGFVGKDALPELRKAVGLELAELLAYPPDTVLSPEMRKLIAAKYREIAAALEGF